MKTETIIGKDWARRGRMQRFNAIRGMTAAKLSAQIDGWQTGWIHDLAMTLEAIEDRDDMVKSVAPKRKKAVARSDWEIHLVEDSQEANRHQKVLKFCYDNLVCTNAFDLNEHGGVDLLVRGMMDAIGKRWAVHELVWVPGDGGLTVECRFVPLYFFENTYGRLRFVTSGLGTYGVEMLEGEWMVTVGDGIGIATAVAWLFKQSSIKDWAMYCERHGMPMFLGKSTAQKDSDNWKAMEAAVDAIAAEAAAVVNQGEDIEVKDLKGGGSLPYEGLVDRMDRAIAVLWRGGDLSSISGGNDAVGESVQGEESATLEQDDGLMISGTLNAQIDRYVIEYFFGEGTKPKAFFKLLPETEGSTQAFKREVWKSFIADKTVADVLANLTDLKGLTREVGLPVNEEYTDPYVPVLTDQGQAVSGETVTDPEGDIVGGAVESSKNQDPNSNGNGTDGTNGTDGKATEVGNSAELVSQALVRNGTRDFAQALQDVFGPVAESLQGVFALDDPDLIRVGLENWLKENPLPTDGADNADVAPMATVLQGLHGAGIVNGIAEGVKDRSTKNEAPRNNQ